MSAATLFTVEGFTSTEVAEASGLSFRQLDYYDGIGVLHPSLSGAKGSGTRRMYSADDIVRARLVAALRALGAPTNVLARVLTQLDPNPGEWPSYLFVSPAGDVHQYNPKGAAWWGVATSRLLRPAVESAA